MQYETTTIDWLTFDNNMSRILEITHVWLVTANIHYGSFGKLIEGPLYLEDFKTPVVESISSTKVIKILALSSSANGSNICSLEFVKCLGYLGSMK